MNGGANIACGSDALSANVSGLSNIAIGFAALAANIASSNLAMGTNTMPVKAAGDNNVAIGDSTYVNATSTSENTAVGVGACPVALTGVGNTALGRGSGSNLTTGSDNIFLGRGARVDALTPALSNCIVLGVNGSANASGQLVIHSNSVPETISGTAGLNGTTPVTIANSAVTLVSRILLTIQTPGGTPGAVYVSGRTAGTSFDIVSTSALDTSTVAYFMFEP